MEDCCASAFWGVRVGWMQAGREVQANSRSNYSRSCTLFKVGYLYILYQYNLVYLTTSEGPLTCTKLHMGRQVTWIMHTAISMVGCKHTVYF
jgi:hypothetical protein